MGKPVIQYSLTEALSDLDNYYFAGTLIGAVQSIQSYASEEEQKAEKEFGKIRIYRYGLDEYAVLLKDILYDPQKKTLHKDKLKKMRKVCWPKMGIPDSTLVLDFINAPEFKEKRKQGWTHIKAAIDKGIPCYGWELVR